MARFILIDQHTGYIWGDSADLDGAIFACDEPADFAAALDTSIDPGTAYEYSRVPMRDAHATYHVYRADVGGSEAVPVIHDGQDQETIEAVTRDCEYVCTLRRDVVGAA